MYVCVCLSIARAVITLGEWSESRNIDALVCGEGLDKGLVRWSREGWMLIGRDAIEST